MQDWIGYSRLEIDQTRLLVLQAAWKMDTHGNKSVHVDVSAIKLVAAQLQTRVVDQGHASLWCDGRDARHTPVLPVVLGRAMRLFDGPDEVHLRTPARAELSRARENLGSTAAYYAVH